LLSLLLGGPCVPILIHHEKASQKASTVPERTKHSPPFLYRGSNQNFVLTSAAAFLLSVKSAEVDSRSCRISTGNAKASHRDGDTLECIAALACVNASQAGGFGGSSASDFLRFLATELQPFAPLSGRGALHWSDGGNLLQALWPDAETTRIPFLPRVEDPYPFRQEGFYVGTYTRTANMDRVDGSISDHDNRTIAIIEGKNYKDGIGVKVVEAIVTRFVQFPGSPPLGIAIVSRVADLRKEISSSLLEHTNLVILRICDNGMIELRRLDDGDDVTPVIPKPRLMCFLECDELYIISKLLCNSVLTSVFKLLPPPSTEPAAIVKKRGIIDI